MVGQRFLTANLVQPECESCCYRTCELRRPCQRPRAFVRGLGPRARRRLGADFAPELIRAAGLVP